MSAHLSRESAALNINVHNVVAEASRIVALKSRLYRIDSDEIPTADCYDDLPALASLWRERAVIRAALSGYRELRVALRMRRGLC
jgi:hypothetical protein